jgi:hypothetical protein
VITGLKIQYIFPPGVAIVKGQSQKTEIIFVQYQQIHSKLNKIKCHLHKAF